LGFGVALELGGLQFGISHDSVVCVAGTAAGDLLNSPVPMNFGPVSQSAPWAGFAPMFRRAFYHARVIGNLAIVQAVVQVLSFLSGILVIRSLTQQEYAYFTIANTMQGTLNLLADIGISAGVISIGGRVWQDQRRFGELINTGLHLRKQLAILACAFVVPILYLLLARNGVGPGYGFVLVALVIAGLLPQLSVGVLSVVPRLRSDISRIQIIDFTAALLRLLGLIALLWFLNAATAIAVAMASFCVQYLMLRRYASTVVDVRAAPDVEDRQVIVRFIRKLAPNALFYCVQGQITVFLISIFAHEASSVAEVGALGRLAMIFAVLSNLLANVFIPAFARCHESRKLQLLYVGIIGGVTAFGALVICAAALFPNQFLFILGNRYTHLQGELLLMVSGAVLASIAGAMWGLNSAKGWISGSWMYIPATLVTQLVLIPFVDFSRVSGVLFFNLISAIPSVLLNLVLSFRGFRSHRFASA
jgi:O-antigen/teichoic acid export membrane protein